MKHDAPMSVAARLRRAATPLALLATAACGGGSGGGGGPVAVAPAPAPAPAPEPAPAPAPAPTPAPDTAQGCLNPQLLTQEGSIAVTRYRVVHGGVERTAVHEARVMAELTWQGRSARRIAVRETISTAGEPDQVFSGNHYLRLNGSSVELVGTEAMFRQAGVSRTQTLRLEPPQTEVDYGLAVGGERESRSAVGVQVTASPAGAGFDSLARIRFVGFETLGVPAGRFQDACKFVLELAGPVPRSSTRWLAQGSGVMLRSESGDSVQELLSATLDGREVEP